MKVIRIRILRDGAERTLDVAAGPVTVGRAAGQTLRIADDALAPEHALLDLSEVRGTSGTWNLEARAALTVDGAPVAAGASVRLRRGARIEIAGWTLIVDEAPPDARPATVERTASLARDLMRDLLGGEDQGGGMVLSVTEGQASGRTIVLPPPPSRVVVGRGEDADVVILDPDLSRLHVAIERDDVGATISDLESKNGTRVSGVRLAAEAHRLRDGDQIDIGGTVLRFLDPAEEFLRALDARPVPVPAPVPVPVPTPVPSLVPTLVAACIAVAALIALLLLLV